MKAQSNKLESRMKIVILHGKHNCGKTTTFNLLYDEIIARGAEIIMPKKDLPARKDFECILKYKEKKVALFSLGDYMLAIGVSAKAERTAVMLHVLSWVVVLIEVLVNGIFLCFNFCTPTYIIVNGLILTLFVLIYISIYRKQM